jgi:S-DNA-T family DNA segregation ATPase FtsK/SpoIIIE
MLGDVVGQASSRYLGFTGATLILLGLMAVGFSLFTGVSWLKLVENLGGMLERLALALQRSWDAYRDRRLGRELAQKREETVVVARKKNEEVPAVRIEPAVMEVPRSPRVEKARQQPLFREITVGGSLPPLELLDEPSRDVEPPSAETLEFTSRLIERKLADFGVEVKVLAAYPGPVITRFEIEPAVGVKGAQIMNLVKDLARALSVTSIRVVETIPGKSCMGLELPNVRRQMVRLSEILGSAVYQDGHSPLTVALGKDIGGQPKVADLAKMPHLLVAGTTGSGKSVGINAMILSFLYKAEAKQVRLILVDPKMLELSVYEGIPHLLAPVVTDMKHAFNALNWCVAEMDKRYRLMSAMGVRNLAGFNHKVQEAAKAGKPLTNPFSITPEAPEPQEELPFIVVVIDELADLMMVVGKKIEELIARLAQKARAAGIHLILATQRPSVDVITGLIKANIPTRMSFQVSSKVDSRTILDQMGAEALLGQGDMLYLAPGTGQPIRVHGAFVSDDEVHRVVQHLKTLGEPDYVEGLLEGGAAGEGGGGELSADPLAEGEGSESDALYDQAVEVVLKTRRPSISLVQRHLRIGYNRAARLIEQMERSGLVSAMNGAGGRDVLVPAKEE